MVTMQKLYLLFFLVCFFISIAAPIFPGATGGMMYHVLFISLIPSVMLPWVLKMKMNFVLGFMLSFFVIFVMTYASLYNEGNINISSALSSLKMVYIY